MRSRQRYMFNTILLQIHELCFRFYSGCGVVVDSVNGLVSPESKWRSGAVWDGTADCGIGAVKLVTGCADIIPCSSGGVNTGTIIQLVWLLPFTGCPKGQEKQTLQQNETRRRVYVIEEIKTIHASQWSMASNQVWNIHQLWDNVCLLIIEYYTILYVTFLLRWKSTNCVI